METKPLAVNSDSRICLIRGVRVMIDRDLARIYGVSTKRLNQQVNRNKERFPDDFMFRLTREESASIVTVGASNVRGGRRYLPYAFTKHGAVMLANVLKTPLAVQASIGIARAFIRLRQALGANKELALKLDEVERRLKGHDAELQALFQMIRDLMPPEPPPMRKIGFEPPRKDEPS
jgi:hypothetical protein